MDLLMGAGFDPHELMAMSYEQCVGLLGRAVSDGRVPAERIDGLRELGLPADTSS